MYLVELLCIPKSASRCCVCNTIRQHDVEQSRAPTMSPLLWWQNLVFAALTSALCFPPMASMGTTHHTHCLHGYSLIALHETSTWNRQTVWSREPWGVSCQCHIRKVQPLLRVTSRAQNPFPLFTSAVRAAACVQPLLSQPETKIPPSLETSKGTRWGKKMFPCYLMLPNSFWWQLCLAPRTAHKVELFSLGSWWHGIRGLFTSEKGWSWRKQNIRCCLEQQESSLHFKSTAA